MRKLLRGAAMAAALLVVGSGVGVGGVPGAAAEAGCAGAARVFAVNGTSGHLAEVTICPSGVGSSAVDVDAGDWRGYVTVLAVRDGAATVVYAVTTSGELWWRRQPGPGAGFGSAVRVGTSLNWNQPSVFVSRPGYLQLGTLRTFRHDGWATGGATVSEQATLFRSLQGPPALTALSAAGFAVETWQGLNFRVWRLRDRVGRMDDDIWYLSGQMPEGITNAVGDGTILYSVDSAGDIVQLRQVYGTPAPCPLADNRPWYLTGWLTGSYVRVVVPVPDSPAGPPLVLYPLTPSCADHTPGNQDPQPWEWQTGGI